MSPYLVAVSIALVAGAVLAVSAGTRVGAVGLLAALVLAPLVTAGPPDPVTTGPRVIAAFIAAFLLRRAAATASSSGGSRIGLPAEALAASGAFLAGVVAHEGATGGLGPAEATAAGVALLALAVGPLLERSDLPREGLGLALAVTGADLVHVGLAGAPSTIEAVVVAAVIALVGTAVALLAGLRSDAIVASSHVRAAAGEQSP